MNNYFKNNNKNRSFIKSTIIICNININFDLSKLLIYKYCIFKTENFFEFLNKKLYFIYYKPKYIKRNYFKTNTIK